jgi:hypothetical protein
MDADKTIDAFPLSWPVGRPRTKNPERSRFRITFGRARDEVRSEVNLLGAANLIISTNLPLRRDGLPYAMRASPDDAGVAAYFEHDGRRVCFACDRWAKIEDNMHAIALTVGALRGIDRWGTGDMLAAAFTGFIALPAPGAAKTWREVLGVGPHENLMAAKWAYRALASENHPDKGGSPARMAEINAAWAQAQEALG